jgi:excisionase family DNA binding protein
MKTDLLKPSELAEELRVSLRTIQRMCERGELPAIKVGRQWRIFPDWESHLERSKAIR